MSLRLLARTSVLATVLAMFLASLMGCRAAPEVSRGEADLRSWDFGNRKVANLDGEWGFAWGKAPEDEGGQGPSTYAVLPGYWNASRDHRLPALGAVTYHLRLRLPRGEEPWALALPDISTAWELSVDGQSVARQGNATLGDGFRAVVQPRIVVLPFGRDEYQLSLYVVNGADRVGGVRDSIRVGRHSAIAKDHLFSQVGSAFFVGGLIVMALFNIIIFFLQRRKLANLWLAVFSVLIALRALVSGPRLLHDLWPGLTFEHAAQLAFFCVLAGVSTFSVYMKNLFPEWWPPRVFIPFLLYTAAFAVLLAILPIKTYAEAFLAFYYLPLGLILFVFLGISFWAVHKKHADGVLVFSGMIFLLVGSLNDLIYQVAPLPQGDLLDKFLFVFLVFNTFVLSRQLSKDFLLTQRQSRELRQLDRMKDDFLARVTHELRTPLHGMTGILDAFRVGDFGPLTDRQSYHLSLLEASSRRLSSMVNSILDFSHLKKHQMISETRPILLRQTIDFLLPSFSGNVRPGVALVNRVSDQMPAALGDEGRLQQVLHHLIRNALQHTESGTVAVEAEWKDQQILLVVRDTGCGIPAEKLSQLFSPFHQVTDLDTRTSGGLGLGLAISKQLVQQMGGRLDVQSQEGVGTTAQIWLPVCPPAKLQYFQAPRIEGVQHRSEPPIAAPVVEPVAPTPGSPTVLIVDDEPVNLLVLRTFLARLGYAVIEASSGPDALEKVNKHVVDLVILDIMMPGMSGYEVCAQIRQRFTPARLPVVLLTAKNQVEDLLQGYQVGASDFLTKPFQREELRVRMALHLKVSQAARTGIVTVEKKSVAT